VTWSLLPDAASPGPTPRPVAGEQLPHRASFGPGVGRTTPAHGETRQIFTALTLPTLAFWSVVARILFSHMLDDEEAFADQSPVRDDATMRKSDNTVAREALDLHRCAPRGAFP